MVQKTSIKSYKEEKEKGLGEKQQEVFDAIKKLKFATDREIADYLQYEDPNQVRPRRFELVQMGLINERTSRPCRITDKTSLVWTEQINSIKPETFVGLKQNQLDIVFRLISKANPFQVGKIKEYLEALK